MLIPSSESESKSRSKTATSAGEQFCQIVLVLENGLAVRSDGTYLQYLECDPASILVQDDDEVDQNTRALGRALGTLEAGRSVQVLVQAIPVDVDDVVAEWHADTEPTIESIELAGATASDAQTARLLGVQAQAFRRLRAGNEETIFAAGGRAIRLRYVAVVSYKPRSGGLADLSSSMSFKDLWRKQGAGTALGQREFEQDADATLRVAQAFAHELRSGGVESQVMNGSRVVDFVWSMGSPVSARSNMPPPSLQGLDILGSDSDPDDAAQRRGRLAQALFQDRIDTHPYRTLQVGDESAVTMQLGSTLQATIAGWAIYAMQHATPWTISVNISALDRIRERTKYARKYRLLFNANRSQEATGRPVSIDQAEMEGETAEIVSELRGRSSVYEMSWSQTFYGPDREETLAFAAAGARSIRSSLDVQIDPGLGEQEELWAAQLPFCSRGRSRKFRYVTTAVAESLPLVGCRAGSEDGAPLGVTNPGLTVARFQPTDRSMPNGLKLICGQTGSGKTVLALKQIIAMLLGGMWVAVVESGAHYRHLASLIPGASFVQIGAEGGGTINPWDVDNVQHPPAEKIEFLVSLHELLLVRESEELDRLEANLLELAIRGVYSQAAVSDTLPRESDLQRVLREFADQASDRDEPDAAGVYRRLADRLWQYVGDGTHAHLLDRPTSIQNGRLLVVDLQRVRPQIIGAVQLVVAEHLACQIDQRKAMRESGGYARQGVWAGQAALFLDETWKLAMRTRTAEWLKELALRSRHLGLTLTVITQQLSDLGDGPGRSLIKNHSEGFYLTQKQGELQYFREQIAFTDAETEIVADLRTAKEEEAQIYWRTPSTSAVIDLRLGALEYWMTSSEPQRDLPLRARALRETNNRPWAALDLVCDPAWRDSASLEQGL